MRFLLSEWLSSKQNNINHMLNSIKICTLLIFVGINLRFATENIVNALIFFNILQSGDSLRYDIHTPSIPDMYGDMVTVIVFALAYLFFLSADTKRTDKGTAFHLQEELGDGYRQVIRQLKNYMKKTGVASILPLVHLETVRQIKNYIRWTKGIFFSGIVVGFGLYLFSKYVLSIGLELLSIENYYLSFFLNTFNDVIKLCSCLVFAYIYCSYLSVNKAVKLALYLFFFVRNLFATNFIGYITGYDLHIVVPFLDLLTPIIIMYSIGCIITSYRSTRLSKIFVNHKYSPYKVRL